MLTLRKFEKGFSLLEVLMAVVAGLAIVMGLTFGFKDLLKAQFSISRDTGVSADADILFKTLEFNFYNVVRIFPEEDLFTSADKKYQGINALDSSVPGCNLSNPNGGPPYAAIRWTAVERRVPPEELLRPYSEDSPGTLLPLGARITYLPDDGRLFYKGNDAKELTFVDADNWSNRRFRVDKFRTVPPTTLDPYDDVTVLSSPIQYTQLLLSPSTNAVGADLSPGDHKFISMSYVYASKTITLCIDPDQNIIFKDESEGTQRSLFNTKANGYYMQAFQIHYLKSKDTDKLDADINSPFPATADEAKCLKNVLISIELKNINDSEAPNVKLVRSFSIPNFSARAPAACNPTPAP